MHVYCTSEWAKVRRLFTRQPKKKRMTSKKNTNNYLKWNYVQKWKKLMESEWDNFFFFAFSLFFLIDVWVILKKKVSTSALYKWLVPKFGAPMRSMRSIIENLMYCSWFRNFFHVLWCTLKEYDFKIWKKKKMYDRFSSKAKI